MEKKEDRKVGYVFSMNMQVGQNKTISINGNFPLDATVQEMDLEMDKVFQALEIQETKRMKIPAVQGALEDQKERLLEEKKKLADLKAKPRLVGAEQHNVKALEETISRLEEVIPKGEQHLAELMQEAHPFKKAA